MQYHHDPKIIALPSLVCSNCNGTYFVTDKQASKIPLNLLPIDGLP